MKLIQSVFAAFLTTMLICIIVLVGENILLSFMSQGVGLPSGLNIFFLVLLGSPIFFLILSVVFYMNMDRFKDYLS
ncbi:hypothetical protein BpOF4_16430 [Alkalihalophilus pseudofirmus OF4]|uniref:Uncharacterized protein n=1 Tax=Alkalihalophilus pseudofirmus (strain ATCC BAA-2126 / JCM 17055 / OF4) TaxID=398511 RepID=D3FQ38_ALKPO|nr:MULTISPECIES: hypothetical protein [Alkalihalophilus]ADC51331.1 hypothetical protein BpOF4_16430 [Alkalihalophilus pseudofirmus OF4]MED1601913.1 hypothetical protein [Alkalihalophilus marmarensis]